MLRTESRTTVTTIITSSTLLSSSILSTPIDPDSVNTPCTKNAVDNDEVQQDDKFLVNNTNTGCYNQIDTNNSTRPTRQSDFVYYHESELELLRQNVMVSDVATNKQECTVTVVLLTGESGMGKTTFVRSLQQHVPYYFEGNFEYVTNNNNNNNNNNRYPPLYQIFITAIQKLLLVSDDDTKHRIRQTVNRTTTTTTTPTTKSSLNQSDRQFLVSVIPELRDVLFHNSSTDMDDEIIISKRFDDINNRGKDYYYMDPMFRNTNTNTNPTNVGSTTGTSTEQQFLEAIIKFLQLLTTSSEISDSDSTNECNNYLGVVLVFDNFHWANPDEMDFCFRFLSRITFSGILFVLSYRNNCTTIVDQSIQDYFITKSTNNNNKTQATSANNNNNYTTKDNSDSHTKIDNDDINNKYNVIKIRLENLNLEKITKVVTDTLIKWNNNLEDIHSISKIIQKQTGGNLFESLEYLHVLREDNLLRTCLDNRNFQGLEQQLNGINNILQYRLTLCSPATQEILFLLSCLGTPTIGSKYLQVVFSESIEIAFEEAINKQWVQYDVINDNSISFASGKIRQTVYDSIPPDDKVRYHYRIGRRLWRRIDIERLKYYSFVIIDHLVIAEGILQDSKERIGIAKLCLCAGEYAVEMSSFRLALQYFQSGITFLNARSSWRDEYDLSLRLHNAVVECSYSSGCLTDSNSIQPYIDTILTNAQTFIDTIRVRIMHLNIIGSSGKAQEASDNGMELLNLLGESFPRNPNFVRTILSMLRLQRKLRRLSDHDILNLPVMVDPTKLAVMQTFNLVFPYAVMTKGELALLIGHRMMSLTIQYGISGLSCMGFAIYANSLCAIGQVEEGYRFGQLGFAILERFQNRFFLPRFYAAYYEAVHCWTRPVKECSEPLMYAHRVGLETGDIEFALVCGLQSYLFKFDTASLVEVEHGLHLMSGRMDQMKQQTMLLIHKPLRQCILNLMGHSTGRPSILSGHVFREEEIDVIKELSFMLFSWMSFYRLLLLYLFGDYSDETLRIARYSRMGDWDHFNPYASSIVYFVDGLFCIARVRMIQRRWAPYAKFCSNRLRRMAIHEPTTYLGKHLLLEAELSSLLDRKKHTIAFSLPKYITAVAVAEKSGSLMDSALANELTGKYLLRRNDTKTATQYIQDAITYYDRWGATAKSRHLSDESTSWGLKLPY